MIAEDISHERSYDVHRTSDGRFQVRFDPAEHHEISTLVCTVLADIAGVDPMDLAPLHHTIDPDALNSLFSFSEPGYSREIGYVHFEYSGFEVTVHANGTIEIARQ